MPSWKPQGRILTPETLLRAGTDAPVKPQKRKTPKAFRVPGERGQTAVTGAHLTFSDDGRTALHHTHGKTLTPGLSADGAALMADALFSQGILTESDWCGSLEKSLRRGLMRWVNEDKGAKSWQFLGSPLSLVYTDDGPAYSTGVRLSQWRDHFRARAGYPIGFFALRFQSSPRPVHVRTMTQTLEAAWPGLGYGLLNLLQGASMTGVQSYMPLWAENIAHKWEQLDHDPFLADFIAGMSPEERAEADALNDDSVLSLEKFHASIPPAACDIPFRLELLQKAIGEAPKTHPELLPVLKTAEVLFRACRRSGLNFYTLNHCQFLSWHMTVTDRQNRVISRDITRLDRAPVAYTVWDAQNDVMTRIVDDYGEFARSTQRYTDLTWMHCFQLGFSGREPEEARRALEARERMVQKVRRTNPEAISFYDASYKPKPMPDGSLQHACLALDILFDILGAFDKLLCLLHVPETLMEQEKAGLL